MMSKNSTPLIKRIGKIIVSVGPAFFVVGYTIGTGSIVTMASAGYTVSAVARRLRLRPSTIWRWSHEPEIASAIKSGKEYLFKFRTLESLTNEFQQIQIEGL